MSPSLFFAHKLRGSSPRFAPSSIIHISLLLQRPPLPFCLRLPSSQTVLHSFQSPKLLPLLPPSMASTRLMSSLSLPLSYHSHLSSPDPFQIQLVLGCDSHFGEASAGFLQLAYQGSDLLSFQNTSWRPSPEGGSRAQKVCSLFNQDHVSHEIVRKLLNEICPWILLSLLDAGKADLQRQARPEAWLSAGPRPRSGHLWLACHVSGFYPKPVWVTWMRGEQEQQGTLYSDILPNTNGTWYLQVSLDAKSKEAAGLSCRVRHSSLGGQDMVLHWDEEGLGPKWEKGAGGPSAELGSLMKYLGI
ncbi:T-cell surface glycoprotein CD1a-like isoform X1 [Canis lupus familiaris]|uniref:T-cell surface glycoprotein CD1a-like isoform X1 n=1 Tax=Canis lupus familiaris TaxID=9615 RepID=UPI0018F7DB80|nr:T-cell surface glycoprotein CD1a-like isoform X1 [Canis lupus familiaris]